MFILCVLKLVLSLVEMPRLTIMQRTKFLNSGPRQSELCRSSASINHFSTQLLTRRIQDLKKRLLSFPRLEVCAM